MEIKEVSLREYSSLYIGGRGKVAEVKNISELEEVVRYAKEKNLELMILGQGTNSYFGEDLSSHLFLILQLYGINVVSVSDDGVTIKANASEIWDDLVSFCVENEYWGIENLSYIPGSVGAAPVQNIGAYGAEISQTLESVEVFDLEKGCVLMLHSSDCAFGYRDSIFKRHRGKYVILSIMLKLSRIPKPNLSYKPLDSLPANATIGQIRDCVINTRRQKLPDYNLYPNAGSFFKNPIIAAEKAEKLKALFPEVPLILNGEAYKVPAAWLIENIAHMKGVRMDNVGTSPTQPLVLINYDNADADEIDLFARAIKDRISAETGIVLEQEVNRVG